MSISTLVKVTGVEQDAAMSREQYNYAVALAMVEQKRMEFQKRTANLTPEETNPYIPGAARDAHMELGIDAAETLLEATENLMIEWAKKQTMRAVGKTRFAQVAQAFDLKLIISQGRKQHLVDICFKLRGR